MGHDETMICQRCGAEIPRRGRAQKYCRPCAEIMRKITGHKKKPNGKPPRGNGGLLAAALEANRRHISYGEYMRMKLAEEG